MGTELLEIQPRELKFTFELEKQSSCTVQLINNSEQWVAFKVKTTSPKRYSVRPNTGVIQPDSSSDFIVTMQAQDVAPSDMQFKDKFLIQSTTIPAGTKLENIAPSMFSKENEKYIEATKLRVVLVSPSSSPVLLPINGALKQEAVYGSPPILRGQENLPPSHVAVKDVDALKLANDTKELKLANEMMELKLANEVKELKLANEVKELKSKLTELETKLSEAETTITMLREESCTTIKERQTLQNELDMLIRNSDARRAQVGFPFLFVCMVAIVSLAFGRLLRP